MSQIIDARFLKFGLVGLSGVAIDFSVTWFCKEKLRVNKYFSNAAGFCCAVINNFLWNRLWTFGSVTPAFSTQLACFALVAFIGGLLNNLLLYLLLKYGKTNFYLTKVAVTGLVFLWNYFINYYFTFN